MLGPTKPWRGYDDFNGRFKHPTKATLPTAITEEYMTFQRNHMTEISWHWWRLEDYPQGVQGLPKQSYHRRAIEEEVNIINTSRVRRTVFIEKTGGAFQEIAPQANIVDPLYWQGEYPKTYLLPLENWEQGFELEIGLRQMNIEFDISLSWEDPLYYVNDNPKTLSYQFTGDIEVNPMSAYGYCFLEPKEKHARQTSLHTHKNYSHRKWWNYTNYGLEYEGAQYYSINNGSNWWGRDDFEIVALYETMDGTNWTGKTYSDFIGYFFKLPPIQIGKFDLRDTDEQQSNYYLAWNSTKASEYLAYYQSVTELAETEFEADVDFLGTTYPMTFCLENKFGLDLQSFSASASIDFDFFDQSAIQ